MQKRRSLWWSSRRVAAGIDVSRQAVRVALVSRRGRHGRVRVDALGGEALPSGACDATGDVDWTAVSRVLAKLTAVRDGWAVEVSGLEPSAQVVGGARPHGAIGFSVEIRWPAGGGNGATRAAAAGRQVSGDAA